ncbi:MAG: glycosidase [Candidatus Marinimicrobia bacterium]|nr:glycosidase [Candidatus Neomarinimicrobiota bacterium]
MKLKRLTNKPVLAPVKENKWEAAAVFNAASVYEDGWYHMIYRASDIGPHKSFGEYINVLGYARSKDLINWERKNTPILVNDVEQELRGPEDPRIVKIDDTFYMTYTGFGNRFPGDFRICMATSKDLIHWERKGTVLDETNKNSALFPEMIDGRYCLFHRREPDIWICYSDDLVNWTDHEKVMTPLPDSWNNTRIGIAGPAVRINEGWFLIYHGVDEKNHYRLGAALLDYKNPAKVLARQTEPIIEPELDWEIKGFIPNVIFSCSTILKDDKIYCIYGGADTVIGVAYLDVKDICFD